MCGIFGCLLQEKNTAPIIHEALKHLEYRGYDSAGIATIYNGTLYVKKDVGKLDARARKIHNIKFSLHVRAL